jgi:tyrosine-protein kinase Etk/Wzc
MIPVQQDGTGVNLAGNVLVIWRHRLLIGGLSLSAILVAGAVSVLSPKIYESTATILSPKESSAGGVFGAFAASALLQQAPVFSVPSLTPNRDMIVSILKSRTIAQIVVERFRLRERYRARYAEDAIRHLFGATTVSVSKEGTVSVKVEDLDPRMAAEVANFYVEQLDRMVSRYATGEAGRQHGFLTEQVARAKADLEISEAALRRFQERNRAISLQDQTKGAIEAAARLKGEVMAAEVQLQVMRNFATEANPEVASLRRRIDEMNRQLAQLQNGSGTSGSARDFAVPFPRVPEVGIELVRLTRDVKVAETLVTLLTQQLEQAKIAEARDLPIVQVLDRAVPAERPSRPRLLVNILLAGLGSLVVGALLALCVEGYRRAPRRSPPA